MKSNIPFYCHLYIINLNVYCGGIGNCSIFAADFNFNINLYHYYFFFLVIDRSVAYAKTVRRFALGFCAIFSTHIRVQGKKKHFRACPSGKF